MKMKYHKYYVLPLYLILLYLFIGANLADAQTTPVQIRVGVVLDMNNYLGEMGMACISLALSDFYATHGHYKTRLVLYNRDSKGDVIGAATAAVDLLKNVEVQAIVGPLYSTQANFMINLGNRTQVPIITFAATSPSLTSIRSPYFIRATLPDSSQVQAISAIIQAFGWREVVLIYVDNEFGEGIIPFMTDALEKVNARVTYRSVFPKLATDDQIIAELYKLMSMQTRVFITHLSLSLGSRIFTKVKQLGMMSEEYAWILTDGMANELNSVDPSVIESMLGVIGVKPYTPRTKELESFRIRYKKKLQQSNRTVVRTDLNIFGIWAHDAAVALAMAAEEARLESPQFLKTNISRNFSDLESLGISDIGPKLITALSETAFTGLSGNFQLIDGQLESPPYQIVNIVGPVARVIGFWTKESGLVKELNSVDEKKTGYSISKSSFRSIIWPGDITTPPKGWVNPTNGKKLRIGVPVKDGFTEFVRVTWNSDNSAQVKGYCIDVFDAVMTALPYGVPYEYVPFATPDHHNVGTHSELAYQVYLGNYDGVAGDVTIVANRSKYVDFTLPFTESGVSMVVPIKDQQKKNALVFLKPLTWELWFTSFSAFVFLGFLIWILEHRINEDFSGSVSHQVGVMFWFAFSTMVFAQRENVKTNLARFVLVIWFFVVLILTQSYTASLTTMLTVQQLQPTLTDVNQLLKNKEYVGYQRGSFVFDMLKRMNFDETRLVEYKSIDECDELFVKGSGNGGIAAAFDEIPYIKLFLAKYCSKYTMVGPTYKTDGFAFVFPIGSPLVPDVSRAILNVTEDEKMAEIEKKWFGDHTDKCPESANMLSSSSLELQSFWVLFMVVGLAAVSAFIIHVIRFLHEHHHVIVDRDPDSTFLSIAIELLRKFASRDLTAPTFRHIYGTDKNGRALEEHDNGQQSPQSVLLHSPPTSSPASTNFSPSVDHDIDLITREKEHSVQAASVDPQGETSQTINKDAQLPDRSQPCEIFSATEASETYQLSSQ